MSVSESTLENVKSTSRKRNLEAAEIEIDVEAPEPPSKKALRKAKKSKTASTKGELVPGSETTPQHEISKEAQRDQRRSDYGIWIGNLSFGTTRDDLFKFFTSTGSKAIQQDQITRINLPLGQPKYGKPANKGFAYIDFKDAAALNSALEFSEALLDGRRVLIKNAKSFEGRPQVTKTDSKESEGKAPSKRIFVGNLDFDTTAEDLEEHFGICGSINNTHMATFEDSGKCKGYAWVEFEQLSSAQTAMRGWVETQDDSDLIKTGETGKRRTWLQKLKGRRLRMEFAEDKVTRYQKRFGKGSKAAESSEDPTGVTLDNPIQEVGNGTRPESRPPREGGLRKKAGKYSDETVQRLTGAIVEAKGKKTTFT